MNYFDSLLIVLGYISSKIDKISLIVAPQMWIHLFYFILNDSKINIFGF